MRLRRVLLGLLGAIVLGAAGILYLAAQPAIPPSDAPAKATFDKTLIARGAELAQIGNCGVCHTQSDGIPYAGGRPMPTPFGTIYATNITPDAKTGIGQWSEAAFLRAMQEGVRRDGAHLYPAFPYDHFTKVSANDLRAIYAFLMTREPVRTETPPNELAFPFQIRELIAGWKLLFFQRGEFKPDPVLTPQLNHGAYLVEGLAHCGACHTPRNMLGAEKLNRYLGGGEAEGWHAPALNANSTAPVPWTSDQLFAYLRQGFVEPHGVAAGPMQDVANNLGKVPEQDVKAIAIYIGALLGPPTAGRQAKTAKLVTRTERGSGSRALGDHAEGNTDGAVIYAGACASCHEPTGQQFSARGIHLASSKVLTMPDPRNLAYVILDGIDPPAGTLSALMPGYADALTERQITALMIYLRGNFTDKPAWSDVEEAVRKAKHNPPDKSGSAPTATR